ncbi:apoptosis-associated speck-like protein containing a CARD [Oreochromis aureus]|uniref:apoptosis-associated speck-like protein containing a CARD n=1 Tax=Oreochromis aureus TaxID=47969 RepID=UPI0019535288|nr:apoptosis-associated speck-like protein containing a CARD [Oreochromis aureus]
MTLALRLDQKTWTISGQNHFVDAHEAELIHRVSNIEPILDDLKGKIIQQEAYDKTRALQTSQEKMRKLYSGPLKAGDASKEAFYQILKKHEKMLIEARVSFMITE